MRGNIVLSPQTHALSLNGRTLQLDVPWEHNGVQYPANWLRLSTAQDRAELGITWVDNNDPTWNQKWYWGYDSDGNLIPKTYTDLKALWIAQTKDTAYKLLQPSDYLWPKLQEENSSFSAAKMLTPHRLGALGVPPSGLNVLRW